MFDINRLKQRKLELWIKRIIFLSCIIGFVYIIINNVAIGGWFQKNITNMNIRDILFLMIIYNFIKVI